ncbi:MAG: YHYH protein [Rhodospirillaceae bacterium]|nr:YHYH protein [Rhodospirillaceae bacterium]
MISRYAGLSALVLLTACGGGGGSSSAPEPESTNPPTPPPTTTTPAPSGPLTVEAGYGRVVIAGTQVTLSATVTEGEASITMWRQTSGTSAMLDPTDSLTPSFTAPTVDSSETLSFEVTAQNSDNTATDSVLVEIWVPNQDPDDGTLLGDFSSRTGWPCDQDPVAAPELTTRDLGDTTEYFTNGIAGHATGTFPNGGNPNTIQTVFQTWEIPREPERTDVLTEMATFGITLEGIKLERDTAESFRNEGVWRYEAITPGLAQRQTDGARFQWLGTDCNNAHVQPTGAYHYHGLPEGLINRLGEGPDGATEMIAGGFAADGFPFYLRYGYRDPNDPQSGLVAMQGSWMLRPGTRPSGPGGPYDGTFREDWEYVEGSGNLDECNGRIGVTPEYPAGIYHYYITDDYPYIPRCVFGTPDGTFRVRR